MSAGHLLGKVAKRVDRRFGIREWLRGEPRPPAGGFDLEGEKLIDWGWICANLPRKPVRALEIGPGKSPIIPAMLALGYHVTAIDPWEDPSTIVDGIDFISDDFNETELTGSFDVVVLCSVVEHIGVGGRFNSEHDAQGDLKAMNKAARLLQTDGQLFLTIPVGEDALFSPWHRVYGRGRLPLLLQGFDVVSSRFLLKEPNGAWRLVSQVEAVNAPRDIRRYALGEMILQRSSGSTAH
jgi:SAM-dependent methyltransferase